MRLLPKPAKSTSSRVRSTSCSRSLRATEDRLQPWPLPLSVKALSERIAAQLRQAGFAAGALGAKPYKQIDALLDASNASAGAGGRAHALAETYAAETYALYAAGPGKRLRASDPAVAGEVDNAFWLANAAEPGLLPAGFFRAVEDAVLLIEKESEGGPGVPLRLGP